MGNCIFLSRPKRINSPADATGNDKILRIVKSDGKILEYGTSILVKDLLMNFKGFGVGISKGITSQYLPPNYELKIGQIYYLLPCFGSIISPSSPLTELDRSGSVKQIKVVITKQQLQDLLSKKVSVDEMLLGVSKGAFDDFEPTRIWRPKLETIPEGRE
ncbi:Protein of unknown function DUF4228 [Macleaya cordata]|uniref:Uncharacterized protein n=1 Tax=Macleaya cordata TaxID=56857 RepID=A0A200Q2R6_MACCD|nr:Protein of unknown function DUF4228 [Macleaya cordata]